MKTGINERRGDVWNPAIRNPKDFEKILMTGGPLYVIKRFII